MPGYCRPIPEISLKLKHLSSESRNRSPATTQSPIMLRRHGALIGTFRSYFLTEEKHSTTRLIGRRFDAFLSSDHYALTGWRDYFGLSRRLATTMYVLVESNVQ